MLILVEGFLIYLILSALVCCVLIYRYAPVYGKKNPLIYITLCSLIGSITVMACKALGLAVKLTFSGQNQFVYPSTYFLIVVVAFCIAVQMNYFNKALDLFSANVVTPIYYVFFTTATILASVLLFQGIYDSSPSDMISVVCGFLTIFVGVFLLNTPKSERTKSFSSLRSYRNNYEDDTLGFVGIEESTTTLSPK